MIMDRLVLSILMFWFLVSCANFDPDKDSYLKSCEITIDMSAMYDDVHNGLIELRESDHIRVSAFFYEVSTGALLYKEDVFLEAISQEYKMSVRKLDVSQDKSVIIFADIVQINDYGDIFGDMYISKMETIDSVRVVKGTGVSSDGRAYYARTEMLSMQQSADCILEDCCRRVEIQLYNAFYLNSLKFDIIYDNFYYFSETPSKSIRSIEEFNYISSPYLEMVFTFLSKSVAELYLDDRLSINLLEYPMDVIIGVDCNTWEYSIERK